MRADTLSADRMDARPGDRPGDRQARAPLVIGLVNILPSAGAKNIESPFTRLLRRIGAAANIHLRLFALAGSPDAAWLAPDGHETLERLWESPRSEWPLDALIVTGAEARAPLMTDEACWPDLRKICDWAGENTLSTLWSCFSAHAAVLHLDGIHRERLPEKLTGVFACERASRHPLVEHMPRHWPAPHSRHNTLNEARLAARGYEILSRSPVAGVDSFVKQHGNSEFVFMQGHLEYGPERLLFEHCRDLRRMAPGQRTNCPQPPRNYLDQSALDEFVAWQDARQSSAGTFISAELARAVAARLNTDWQAPARQFFISWLGLIAGRKSAQAASAWKPGLQAETRSDFKTCAL